MKFRKKKSRELTPITRDRNLIGARAVREICRKLGIGHAEVIKLEVIFDLGHASIKVTRNGYDTDGRLLICDECNDIQHVIESFRFIRESR